ncbi:MAG: tRNA-dihydrouridine synthase family protein [Euryarchaeota archaeon]|nr:tRNA-dihydrouridine synthase family protein [Euryarchaeota archaeon]MBT5593979.1 tRNA-dihydrouridine synthase family protein [Euryarchaeota archaeon]MBT6640428.1 tRNA-dihydrouridine synthase family protein [Euryarchaeota archaeon]MBT6844516.1 tRNA-dihydrouridine synthase family protein [Euryarchaeota archaeon]MBT7064480.1 tRNA-dihydrouridine synthase family protein [Euryarchaeota archaeon]
MSEHIGSKPGAWGGEARPLFLAPMAGVSDLPFRLLAKACGADVTITEFTNSTALSREAAMSWRKMESHATEIPFIPQIFGGDAGDMATAAEMLAPTADVIDLNFGCPAPKVTKICAGAALMGEPDNLVSMVEGIIQRVEIPVSAKMRLGTGLGANNALEICKDLENIGTSRLCIHGRTLRQRYSGEADWNSIKHIVDGVEIPVIANGDVVDAASAKLCLETTDAAGLMIGRGAIGRPAVFGEIKVGLGWMDEEDLPWIKELGEDWYQRSSIGRAFATRKWCWDKYIEFSHQTSGLQPRWMQRHAIAFTKGLPGAKKIRNKMHGASTPEDFANGISNYLATDSSESN